jgi:hypothetical protein
MIKIGTVEGYWSTNIGNSFFQMVAKEMLGRLDVEVVVLPDVAGYANINKDRKCDAFEISQYLELDYLCVQGPIFRREFMTLNYRVLKDLTERGVKLIGLGIGCMHYESDNLELYDAIISDLDWAFISTRDERTYNMLEGKISNLHNGVDLGFFLSMYFPMPKLNLSESLICFNFDQTMEPRVKRDDHGKIQLKDGTYGVEKRWSKEPRGIFKKLFPFIRPFFVKFSRTNIGGMLLVRTDHRFNPYAWKRIYSDRNVFASDTPIGYLMIYANSEITLSNRVHANVATLSYGGKSMYLSDSKRASLLDRMGLETIYKEPMSLSRSVIETEHKHLIGKLSEVLGL